MNTTSTLTKAALTAIDLPPVGLPTIDLSSIDLSAVTDSVGDAGIFAAGAAEAAFDVGTDVAASAGRAVRSVGGRQFRRHPVATTVIALVAILGLVAIVKKRGSNDATPQTDA